MPAMYKYNAIKMPATVKARKNYFAFGNQHFADHAASDNEQGKAYHQAYGSSWYHFASDLETDKSAPLADQRWTAYQELMFDAHKITVPDAERPLLETTAADILYTNTVMTENIAGAAHHTLNGPETSVEERYVARKTLAERHRWKVLSRDTTTALIELFAVVSEESSLRLQQVGQDAEREIREDFARAWPKTNAPKP